MKHNFFKSGKNSKTITSMFTIHNKNVNTRTYDYKHYLIIIFLYLFFTKYEYYKQYFKYIFVFYIEMYTCHNTSKISKLFRLVYDHKLENLHNIKKTAFPTTQKHVSGQIDSWKYKIIYCLVLTDFSEPFLNISLSDFPVTLVGLYIFGPPYFPHSAAVNTFQSCHTHGVFIR